MSSRATSLKFNKCESSPYSATKSSMGLLDADLEEELLGSWLVTFSVRDPLQASYIENPSAVYYKD